MIKNILKIWLIMMALAGILVGCNGVPQYDHRLTQADSLMSTPSQRKAALDQLINIPPNSLTKESDKAYLALLLTEARYKNYERITSDEVINSAIEYYEHHPKDQEKQIASFIRSGEQLQNFRRGDFDYPDGDVPEDAVPDPTMALGFDLADYSALKKKLEEDYFLSRRIEGETDPSKDEAAQQPKSETSEPEIKA